MAQEGIAHVPGLDFGVGAGSTQRLDKLHHWVVGFPPPAIEICLEYLMVSIELSPVPAVEDTALLQGFAGQFQPSFFLNLSQIIFILLIVSLCWFFSLEGNQVKQNYLIVP